MKRYYTSDWHLFHKNIIRYSNRPFANVDEMNQTIIDRTNERVGADDTLYIVGDVAFARPEKTLPLMRQLRCRDIHLVAGNHDPLEMRRLIDPATGEPFWKSVSDIKEVNDEGRRVVLCHYMMAVFNRSHHGAFQLFGHSHGSMPGNSQQIDVGVDCWDFRPVTLDECIARMNFLPAFRSKDHHV